MAILHGVCCIAQVGNGLPGPISFRPTFPMHKILQPATFVPGVNDVVNLVILLTILCDMGGAWGSHRLTWQVFKIWLCSGDVNDGVDAHRAGKVEFCYTWSG